MDNLRNQAEEIRGLLENQPVYAADLIIDFIREFSTNEEVHDQAILLRLELSSSLEPQEISETTATLERLITQVIEEYDQKLLAKKAAEEKALTEKLVQISLDETVVLKVKDLRRKFSSTGFLLKVDHFELRLGQIVGLLGENATGKTTLFNILAGELLKSSGKIEFPIFQGSRNLNWFKLKQEIAYVPQELPVWKGALLETLHYEATLHGIFGVENDRAVNYVIQRLGLDSHVNKSWKQLSGGYKLRFSLAKALISGARLLLLDEPLANLDIKTQQIVLDDLYHVTKSKTHPLTILISSQHLHEIEAVADWIYYLDSGKLEDLGPMASYRKDRKQNVFELSTPLPTKKLMRALLDFPHLKQWSTGTQFFITTPLEVRGEQLIAHLAVKGISVKYFRDISQSVKTRFYATLLS